MKALSLRQPWAYAVLRLGKTIENRRWNTSFRGTFLIHAAKGMTRDEYEEACDFCDQTQARIRGERTTYGRSGLPPFERLQRGGIVGRAKLVNVIPPCAKSHEMQLFGECSHAWHMPEQYGFVLHDVEPLPFVPSKGALGFFDVPDDVIAPPPSSAADKESSHVR